METVVKHHRADFIHWLAHEAPELDAGATFKGNHYSFVTTDGKGHTGRNFSQLLTHLNKVLGFDFDTDKSTEYPAYVLVIKGPRKLQDSEGSADDAVAVKESEIPAEGPEENLPEPTADEQPEEPGLVVDQKTAIITEAQSLYDDSNKKESKEKLADFAKSKGVELDKRATFDKMIEQLRAAI